MPSQYIDKINLPGNKKIELRDTISELKDVNITSLASGNALVFNGSSWVNHTISGGGGGGLNKIELYFGISTTGRDEIFFSDFITEDLDICDLYIENDGTVPQAPIWIDALPKECVNIYLKNTNTTNPQGITVRFKFGSDFIDYAVYDDGNITYNSDYIDINIPRNKAIEFSIKQYLNTNNDPVISIIYSDPLTIQAI